MGKWEEKKLTNNAGPSAASAKSTSRGKEKVKKSPDDLKPEQPPLQ